MNDPELASAIRTMRGIQTGDALDESNIAGDPIEQFARWLKDAMGAGIELPTAMTLATASAAGIPSARKVLLKGFDADGFVFFTNYASRKGRDLAENPNAALVFHWDILHRQVCIEGSVTKIPPEDSDAYWITRPRGSKVSARASRQSEVIRDRAELESGRDEVEVGFPGEVPRPDFWGGYRLRPESIEFWQGRKDRLHDRLRFMRSGEGWRLERLSP